MFWVAMSEYPELNSKIKLMSAFAPIAYLEHMPSPFSAIAPFCNQIEVNLAIFLYLFAAQYVYMYHVSYLCLELRLNYILMSTNMLVGTGKSRSFRILTK